MGDDPAIVAGRKCLKCDEVAGYYSVNPKQAVYCRECFIKMVHHKFTTTLGKNRVFKDGADKKVLVVWSGSLPDDFLLSTVRNGVSQKAHKRLEAVPTVLVILEAATADQLHVELKEAKRRQEETSSNLDFPWIFVHLAEVFNENICQFSEDSTIEDCNAAAMKYIFAKATAKSDRVELKRLLRDLLIYRMAVELRIPKVMVSDSAEIAAKNSFDALCFGRGAAISKITAPLDTRFSGVTIIRPLREVYENDMRLVLQLECDSRTRGSGGDAANQVRIRSSTVQDTNLEFLMGLQSGGFPSTMTAVIGTSVKVLSAENGGDSASKCCLCFAACCEEHFCACCTRLMEAIPGFPDALKDVLVRAVGKLTTVGAAG